MRLVTLGGAGGIAMLLRGVLRAMFERFPQHQFVCFNTIFNRGLLGEVPANVELNTLPLTTYFQDVARLCSEKAVDVLFRGYPLEQDIDFPLERQIVEIPDIQHEYFPEFFAAEALRSRRAAFGKVLAGAGAIGTISEFARKTLLDQPNTCCRDIFLMCPALQVEHSQHGPLTDAEQALIPDGDYFLFPANLWKHKNHQRALQAFERCLHEKRHPVRFLFTGHPNGWEQHQKEYGHLPIHHLGFVRPALLRKLLESAKALVFFSLYEGFGMPLLEAFDAGTPVLCSNTTSLPEVGGDAVLNCDPTNIHAMSELMVRILREPALRAELIARGRERLKVYSWEQSADNLMAACRRVAKRLGIQQSNADGENVSAPTIQFPPSARVALVTPSYNQGRFLRRTIDSVLAQSYPLIDYVVIDGGSTDETLDVLRSYGDRVKWISEPDRGQSHAINKGLALVQGEIQAYLNSDDVLLPGAVEKAVRYLLAHPDCDLVYGKAHFIDENDHILGDYNTADYSFERLLDDCCISQPAAFWRKRIADRIGSFDENLHLAMDYDYWQRIDRAGGRIEYLREHLACTRIHAETKTSSKRTQVYDEAIRVSLKNAGFASLNYFQGLWHHRLHEKSKWRFSLRRIPRLPQIMGRLHHWWANRATYSGRKFLGDMARLVKRRFGNRLKPILLGWQRSNSRLGAVDGFWGDNWMGETCTVRLSDSVTGDDLQLTGIPSDSMHLTVSSRENRVGTFFLEAHKLSDVRFYVAPGQKRQVVLRFSKHQVDAAGRRLSFLLQGTNLFGEQDLAA